MLYLRFSFCSEYHPFPAGAMELFSSADSYNRTTTRNPIICQFRRNAHFIRPVLLVIYEKGRNCTTFYSFIINIGRSLLFSAMLFLYVI